MAIRRKYRYVEGGLLPSQYGQIGQTLGNIYDSVTPEDQYGVKSDFNAGLGSALNGAGQGAAIGSMILPGIGTAAGGILGGIAGGLAGIGDNNKKIQAARLAEVSRDRMEATRSKSILQNYDQKGSNQNQIYAKYGGSIRSLALGGNLTQLSDENMEVNGASHEQGGVNLGQGIEVEGGETINKNFVFSEELGFAQKHKPIARAIGKIEKKPSTQITRTTLNILRGKEEALKQEQESLKQQLGIDSVAEQYDLGGEITDLGDQVDPPTRQQILEENYNKHLLANENVKPLAPIEAKDPIFYDSDKYNAYYSSKAASRLSPEEQQVYKNHVNAGRTQDAQDLVVLRGGILDYDTYKSFLPKDVPNPNAATAGFGSPLPVRKEASRVGFNRGRGRLGFRLTR